MGCTSSTAAHGHRRFHDQYRLGKKLGEGAFGQVRIAKPRNGGPELAVKIVDARSRDAAGEPRAEPDKDRLRVTRAEITVWEQIGECPHCVSLRAHFFDQAVFYMVMEKCCSSLMDRLASVSSMREEDLLAIFQHMLGGIRHIHAVQIVHRDIKPDNFLFVSADERDCMVKLCDFGLAAALPKKGLLKGVFGTAPYMSPEMLGGGGYDLLTDVWSYGVTAFLMIYGDFPYSPKEPTAASMKRAILADHPAIQFLRPEHEMLFSREFVDRATPFLRALLQRTPATRPTIEQSAALPLLQPASLGPKEAPVVVQDLAPVMRKARKITRDLCEHKKMSPVVQRNLDDLMRKLNDKSGGLRTSSRYFSETDGDEAAQSETKTEPTPADDRIMRRRSDTRHSTHSGVLSKGVNGDFKAPRTFSGFDVDGSTATATPVSLGEQSPSDGGGARRPRVEFAEDPVARAM